MFGPSVWRKKGGEMAMVMQGVAGGDLPMVCPILECRYMLQIFVIYFQG